VTTFLRRIRAGYAVVLVAGLATGAMIVGVARASAPAATVHHYSIAASAFAPDGLHDTTMDYFNQWDPTVLSNQYAGRCFNAALDLPAGATLKSAVFHYTAGVTTVMFMDINQQNLTNHTSTDLVSFDSTESTTSPTYTNTNKPLSGTVNGNFGYSVGVCPQGDSTFSGITINYTG
jgi:hypothetical protein